MAAHNYESLNSSNTRRIQLNFQKCLGAICEEFRERLGEGDERGVIARLKGTPDRTPATSQLVP